ncbi:MAG: hypothetical protein N3F11_03575 [Casimicrobiaceae bacterium]|nr:hypothetical protein [Casimicrobiaceae bacterium]
MKELEAIPEEWVVLDELATQQLARYRSAALSVLRDAPRELERTYLYYGDEGSLCIFTGNLATERCAKTLRIPRQHWSLRRALS